MFFRILRHLEPGPRLPAQFGETGGCHHLVVKNRGRDGCAHEQVTDAVPQLCRLHRQGFAVDIRSGVFPLTPDMPGGELIGVPREDADGLALGH